MSSYRALILSTILLSGCSAFGAAAVEEPPYSILEQDGRIEVRQYGELLVAQTEVEGDYDEVGRAAFRRLAGFIFGDNQSEQKVAMTAPVLQEPKTEESGERERIATTAAVFQERSRGSWVMTFVMPAEYTRDTLPKPLNPAVTISTIPAKRVATIRFSGLMSMKKLNRYSTELVKWIEDKGFIATSAPRSAGYNPPWTLPPLRRNEIHIDIR